MLPVYRNGQLPGNKRINKSQIEKKGLKLQLDSDLQQKMQEYKNAKTTQETGKIGEETSSCPFV
jgi:hypothetical protein